MTMLKPVVMDFDDLCDTNDPMDALRRLKDRDSNFKVTLFAIPARCGDALLSKYDNERDWISLGIHGWRHSRHECLSWTHEETADKIEAAKTVYPHFAPIFKAPNWEICDEVYVGLKNAGIVVADHIRNIEILPADQPHYIYNVRLRQDKYQRAHGHIQPWAGTGLTENVNGHGVNEAYVYPVGTEYRFAVEVAESRKELAV